MTPASTVAPSEKVGGQYNGSKKPPKPWWEYEEALARLAYDLKAEAAAAKAAHTRDLGILLQQQLALRGRLDELSTAFDKGEGATAENRLTRLGRDDRLAASVAETAKDATELQLALLERGAASLRQEAEAAKDEADAARQDAKDKAAQISQLHSQLASAVKRVRRLEEDARRAPRPPLPPEPPKPPEPPDPPRPPVAESPGAPAHAAGDPASWTSEQFRVRKRSSVQTVQGRVTVSW